MAQKITKKWTIRKMVEFECAHQLTKAVSELCNLTIHGHSYKVELLFSATHLVNDMVLDFGALVSLKEAIMAKYDHALFMHQALADEYGTERLACNNKRLTIIPDTTDPTAEWMAADIYNMCDCFLRTLSFCHVTVEKVRVHETRTGWAEYSETRED